MNVPEKVTWHKLREICADTSQSRSKIYQDISAGRLIVHKSGKSTLVSSINRRKYYDSFTLIKPKRIPPATEMTRAVPTIQPRRRMLHQPVYDE